MRIIRTSDSKEHLCNTCVKSKDFPQCLPDDVEFGNGKGNDNIIACSQCVSPYSETIYPAELSKLKSEA
jgi:hypothetical protein